MSEPTLPTTIEELRPWLDDSLKVSKPNIDRASRQRVVEAIIRMIPANGIISTFAEGWQAAATNTVDPKRFESSLQSMKDSAHL